jgi:prefoldin alpha subunit
MEENNQEFLFKLSMFEQQIQQMQQQINAVEEGIMELSSLNIGLGEINNSEGKEILAPVGRGIFIKSKITSENLVVDVGGRNFVKKSVSETQEIIKKQIEKLEEIKKELTQGLEEIGREAEKIISEAQKN